jgi:hypothetical protein
MGFPFTMVTPMENFLRRFVGFWVLVILLAPALAKGADKFTFIFEKQEVKEKHRWSISDWLETRDRMRVQDLWLAMHLPSPYEFYVGGMYRTGNAATNAVYQGWGFTAAAYAYVFGFEVQRDMPNADPRWLALGNFRLFGPYNQATNLTLQFGAKGENRGGIDLWNLVAGGHLTLYVAKPFGGTFLYRHAFSSASGVPGESDRFEVGAFLDFRFLRLHVDYFSEVLTNDTSRSFRGLQFGTRLYF